MALDGIGNANGFFRVTPPQIQQWQSPDGQSWGMSWNMSWEYGSSTQNQANGQTGPAGGGPDTTSLPGTGLSSALGLDSLPAAASSIQEQIKTQVTQMMQTVKAILARLGFGEADAASVPGESSVPGAGGPAAASVPGSTPGAGPGSTPGSTPGSVPPGSTPEAGGPEDDDRDDGSKFSKIAGGVAGIIGAVFGGLSRLRAAGGGFGGGSEHSPLTFDLDGDGKVGTTGIEAGRKFDLDGDGKIDQTAWAAKGDGVLAFDGDGDGKAGESGKELLGNASDVGDGKKYRNGFDALRGLAVKHLGEGAVADGKLDAAELSALEKTAGLTMVKDGHNVSLGELGISQISLDYQEAGANRDASGNAHRQVGAGFVQNGQSRKVDDVWFKFR